MTELRKRLTEALLVRRYSPRTIQCYVECIRHYAEYFKASPVLLGPVHIRQYQHYLVEKKKVSWSRLNQTVCALRYLYVNVMNKGWMIEHIPYPRKERKLPVVLSREEVGAFLGAIRSVKHRTALTVAYGAGLRISEVIHLRVEDIESERMMIRVNQGKGRKDRYVTLSEKLLEVLRVYWKQYRPRTWLFPGREGNLPMNAHTLQSVCVKVRRQMGMEKKVSAHTLRHCFATHLMEMDVNLFTLRRLLGHRFISTTARYTHVSPSTLMKVKSPLDRLPLYQE